MVKKVNFIETKIPNTSRLVTKNYKQKQGI